MRWWHMGVGAVVLLAAAASCGGDDANKGSGGAGGAAIDTYASSDCGTCVHDACGAEIQACATEPGCASYLECLDACPLDVFGNAEQACEAACPKSESSASQDLVAALTACRADGPGAACTSCGVISVLDQQCAEPTTETEPCRLCEAQNCCETRDACRAEAECVPYLECWQSCPSDAGEQACTDQCIADHASGVPAFGDKYACIIAKCNSECGGNACSECWANHCPNTAADCYGNGDCISLQLCVGNCNDDAACFDACEQSYPAGVDALYAFLQCNLDSCAAECIP